MFEELTETKENVAQILLAIYGIFIYPQFTLIRFCRSNKISSVYCCRYMCRDGYVKVFLLCLWKSNPIGYMPSFQTIYSPCLDNGGRCVNPEGIVTYLNDNALWSIWLAFFKDFPVSNVENLFNCKYAVHAWALAISVNRISYLKVSQLRNQLASIFRDLLL